MSLENQEVVRTFQDADGRWIQFRFKKLKFMESCEIKTKRGWKEYGQSDSQIKALREAKIKWNQENAASPVVGKLIPFKEAEK